MLKKFKYFGLRYIYYRIINKYPYLLPRLLDIFKPSLISRYYSKKIIREFYGYIGHAIDEKNESYLGLGMLHYDLIRIIKPKRVLCIGSYRGFIPAICALACQDNFAGYVDFVDVGTDLSGVDPILGDGFWRKIVPKEYFSKLIKDGYIKTYIMSTKEFTDKFGKRKYGYIYIDGDHTYRGIQSDYNLLWPMLIKGGYMAFHDVFGKGIGNVKFGVNRFWNEIKFEKRISFGTLLPSGLGFIQK